MDVLVPIDDSEPARAAIEHVVHDHPEASITILHVVDPSLSAYGEGGAYAYESLLESRKSAGKKVLEDARELAADHEGDLTTKIVVGDPARKIVAFADEHGHDRIVIGSHGRSGAERILLGSVAEQVARRAGVPVTIVR